MKQTDTELNEQAAEAEPVIPAHLTNDQIDELRERAAKADENWDRYVRTVADLENFKKRAARERQEGIKFANESLLQDLIPVLDNFDMALTASRNAKTNTLESLQAGIAMIYQQL